MPAVLFVLSSHPELGSTGRPTGFYLPEAAHPHEVLTGAGVEVDFASPRGGAAPIVGADHDDPVQRAFLTEAATRTAIERTIPLADVDAERYDGILFVGGHGTMWDFPDDPVLATLAPAIYERGGVVAAVCHGPAALVNLRLSGGEPLVAGRRVTAFSDDEERAVGLAEVVPFLLASTLRERGGLVTNAPNFEAHVETDGRLVTGQNPASARGVAGALLERLPAGAAVS